MYFVIEFHSDIATPPEYKGENRCVCVSSCYPAEDAIYGPLFVRPEDARFIQQVRMCPEAAWHVKGVYVDGFLDLFDPRDMDRPYPPVRDFWRLVEPMNADLPRLDLWLRFLSRILDYQYENTR